MNLLKLEYIRRKHSCLENELFEDVIETVLTHRGELLAGYVCLRVDTIAISCSSQTDMVAHFGRFLLMVQISGSPEMQLFPPNKDHTNIVFFLQTQQGEILVSRISEPGNSL